MKIRFITKDQVKKAYDNKKGKSSLDVKNELSVKNMENIPQEVFKILQETLKFIEYLSSKEEDLSEDK